MSSIAKTFTVAIVTALVAGCAASAAKRDTAVFVDGDRLHTGTTIGTGGGSVSGAATAPPASKEQRASTPVGTDRDGQGPATGAIVDPTGAATGKKP